jgi:hypothetical protein
MSALGQEQTFSGRVPMYALPPKADIGSQPPNARLVPKADIDSSKQFFSGDKSISSLLRHNGHKNGQPDLATSAQRRRTLDYRQISKRA